MPWFSCGKGKASAHDDDKQAESVYWHPREKAVITPLDTTERLTQLRRLLSDNKIDYYLIPSSDAHGSEFVADRDRRQQYISGFSGESSMAIVGQDGAALFVDGRYHDSAGTEIDSNWELQKVGLQGVLTWQAWVKVGVLAIV